jgi:hypothetical protein
VSAPYWASAKSVSWAASRIRAPGSAWCSCASRTAAPAAPDEVSAAEDRSQPEDRREVETAVVIAGACPATLWGRFRRYGRRGRRLAHGGRAERFDRVDHRSREVAVAKARFQGPGDDVVQFVVADLVEAVRDPNLVGPILEGNQDERVIATERVPIGCLVDVFLGGAVPGRLDEEDGHLDAVVEGRLDRVDDVVGAIGQDAGRIGDRTLQSEDVLGKDR